jgi:hypothetical protein
VCAAALGAVALIGAGWIHDRLLAASIAPDAEGGAPIPGGTTASMIPDADLSTGTPGGLAVDIIPQTITIDAALARVDARRERLRARYEAWLEAQPAPIASSGDLPIAQPPEAAPDPDLIGQDAYFGQVAGAQ